MLYNIYFPIVLLHDILITMFFYYNVFLSLFSLSSLSPKKHRNLSAALHSVTVSLSLSNLSPRDLRQFTRSKIGAVSTHIFSADTAYTFLIYHIIRMTTPERLNICVFLTSLERSAIQFAFSAII